MAVEIKELVIKTILDRSPQNNSSSQQIQLEVKRQLDGYMSQIVDQCVEIISDGIKKQGER